jgi:hypothetical protein
MSRLIEPAAAFAADAARLVAAARNTGIEEGE